MPWQAHLYVGEVVHDDRELMEVCRKIGGKFPDMEDDPWRTILRKAVSWPGGEAEVLVEFVQEQEGGSPWPVDRSDPYTDALVGFPLTRRYRPAILDRAHPNGSPEPFVVDLDEV